VNSSTPSRVTATPGASPDAAAPAGDDAWANMTLLERVDLNDELAVFRVLPDAGVPDFEPGQFVVIGVPGDELTKAGKPKMIRRAYSIASSPTLTDCLELYIVRVEGGELTPRLWQLEQGARLWVGPKVSGKFTLDDVPDGKVLVMVGTGTGTAPFRAMYQRYRDADRWRKLVLFDGCRLVRDLGYLDEFNHHAAHDPSLLYLPTVTREPDSTDWPGLRGRVTTYLEPDAFKKLTGEPLTPENCSVFLCGNPAMIDQIEASLTEIGFAVNNRECPDGTLHFERYW
jgi:ferredoxin--NADP+ reductase